MPTNISPVSYSPFLAELYSHKTRTAVRRFNTRHVHLRIRQVVQTTYTWVSNRIPKLQNIYAELALYYAIRAPPPPDYSCTMSMVAAHQFLSLCLVVVSFLFPTVTATHPDSHLNQASAREYGWFDLDQEDMGDLIDGYLRQFQNKVWEVLASHGIQVQHYTLPEQMYQIVLYIFLWICIIVTSLFAS